MSTRNYRYAAPSGASQATDAGDRLIDLVARICDRLSGAGWAELLACHSLDLRAPDLASELRRELQTIDRSQPGFEDFAHEGTRAIEPGQPSLSLLFHAFASPEVTHFRSARGKVALQAFPTPTEIEILENYVYGARPPSVEDLRARAGGAPLAIVVFALEYRPAIDTVHRRHADMCYARTGVARIGTRPANHVPAARGFLPLLADGHQVAVQPCRYAAFIAALKPGAKGMHGPLQFVETKPNATAGDSQRGKDAGLIDPPSAVRPRSLGDAQRQFWVPLHKLFDGAECLAGHTISVGLASTHINEKIRRAHLFFGASGHDSGWREPDISQSPFVIQSGIAEFSTDPAHGSWLLAPVPHACLVEPAAYLGEPLTYIVPKSAAGTRWRAYESSLNLTPAPSGARSAPEYLHARHLISEHGEKNLNEAPHVVTRVQAGGYRARHYVDFTGDGYISVECAALALEIPRRLPAYSIVASPDFFPAVRQSDLVAWTDQSAPPALLPHIWPVNPGRPEPLSGQRYAANLELKQAGFDEQDDTMTAIVGACSSGVGEQMPLRPAGYVRASMLPDGASGVFAPGWDVSYDRTSEQDAEDDGGALDSGITFLNNYGLGSPFPEDSMLCAALSSFWPAVAPDITRTFAPNQRYSTATPLTDDVIGLGTQTPWDGIRGPVAGSMPNTLDYKLLAYGDYVEATLASRFDVSAIGRISVPEYVARTLTMAMVYEALGVTERLEKARWSVLSFTKAAPDDPELLAALAAHGRRLDPTHTYRYELVKHSGAQLPHPDPTKFDRVLVPYVERVLLFADPTLVLRHKSDGSWAQPYERSR